MGLCACDLLNDKKDYCRVKTTDEGQTKVICPDGSEAILAQGPAGGQGVVGDDSPCSFEAVEEDGVSGQEVTCPGYAPIIVWDGAQGATGAQGDAGYSGETGGDGDDAQACTRTDAGDGSSYTLSCGGQTIIVEDGTDGDTGPNGTSGANGGTCFFEDDGAGAMTIYCCDDGGTSCCAGGAQGCTDGSILSYAYPFCGNGISEFNEHCDDANADETDGCSSTCFGDDAWALTGEPYTDLFFNDVQASIDAGYTTRAVNLVEPTFNISGGAKWIGGVLGLDGNIYTIPYFVGDILVIKPGSDESVAFKLLTPDCTFPVDSHFAGGALGTDGKIYAVPAFPYTESQVLVIDYLADAAEGYIACSLLNIDNVQAEANSDGWYGAVAAPNGKIYGMPYNSALDTANNVLVIDPASASATTFLVDGLNEELQRYAGGVLANNGKIYAIPWSESRVMEITPAHVGLADTARLVGDTVSGFWIGGVLAANGHVYGIPYVDDNMLEIEPATGSVTTFSLGLGVTGLSWSGGVLGSNGIIYGIPYSASGVLLFYPSTRTGALGPVGNPASEDWVGGVLAENGHIYGIPHKAGTVLDIDLNVNRNFSLGLLRSGYLNKL
jgi:cysteine-rich repeat protein